MERTRKMRPTLTTIIFILAVTAAAFAQGLPQAIKNAFDKTYPGASIASASQIQDAGQTVFRIVSVDRGRSRVVLYESGGKVVEVAEQVEEKDLPKPVAAAMHSHPRAIYVSGMKVTRGTNVEYRLTLRGTRKTAMIAKPDGTVLSFQ